MTTLITGAGGYVGVNLAQTLLERRREVVLFDAQPLPAAAARVLGALPGRFRFVQGDIRDAAALDAACTGVDGAIHCAAITSGPEREASAPGSVFDVNVGGTVAILAAVRRNRVRRIVLTSSGAVYGESLYSGPPMREEATPVLPETLYATSKYAAERAARRLAELWRIDVVVARLGTVIGPWERDTGVRDNFGPHSQLAQIACAGGDAILPATELTRDWIYSRDVAAGLVALLDAPSHRHFVYNLSAGLDWQGGIQAWCERLVIAFPDFRFRIAQVGEPSTIHYTDRSRLNMDISRLADPSDVGFRPAFDIERAYDHFAQWLREQRSA